MAAALAVVGLFFIFNDPFTLLNQATPAAPEQLVAQDEVVGTGPVAASGDVVTVHYTGKLQDGTVFDTSLGKAPIEFTLGRSEVIPGWEQGLIGMKQGGKRLLIIPPSLGYGASGYGPIPANATLIFDVELVKVTRPQ